MKVSNFRLPRLSLLLFTLVVSVGVYGQEADNEFSISAKLNTRGELRYGGFKADSLDNDRIANFILGSYQLDFDYKRSWLELHLSPKQAGVWGQAAGGGLSLAEVWALVKSKNGFFAKIGRQILNYDDERILGYDDWTMTAPTHDVLKFGYEGHGHKVHLILAYNQNADNPDTGNTYYSDGIQPHKSMQTLWYRYDTPSSLFGGSLLFMNVGMQSTDPEHPKTYYQQLLGTYLSFTPKHWAVTGSFYYQMGRQEDGIPISAFMGNAKVQFTPNDIFSVYAGYDYLSGDKYFALPPHGAFGMVFHDTIRGFNSIYGSHHDFYGAMDFFYLDSFVGNFTPGLQNLFVGGTVNPVKKLNINLSYHYFAIATNLDYVPSKSLGHDFEIKASYAFSDFVKLSAGFSYLMGTETMTILQQLEETRRMRWGWLMLSITPKIYTTTWQDKK